MNRKLAPLLCGIFLSGVLLLGGCITGPSEPQEFPPPEGYDSWDEYQEERERQTDPSQTTPETALEEEETEPENEHEYEERSALPRPPVNVAPIDTVDEPIISAEIELDYSWQSKSGYTSVPIYITNLSDHSRDITVRIKAFNSDEVTVYDEEHEIANDIWPEETYYDPITIGETEIANLAVTVIRASRTVCPIISSRTDLVILDDMPIVMEQEEPLKVQVQNTTSQSLEVYLKCKGYDAEGYLRLSGCGCGEDTIDPFETKLITTWSGRPSTTYEYFVYLVDED